MSQPRVTAVLSGERVPMPCEGGFIRRTMTSDGIVVETDTMTLFLTEAQVHAAMALLMEKQDGRYEHEKLQLAEAKRARR